MSRRKGHECTWRDLNPQETARALRKQEEGIGHEWLRPKSWPTVAETCEGCGAVVMEWADASGEWVGAWGGVFGEEVAGQGRAAT